MIATAVGGSVVVHSFSLPSILSKASLSSLTPNHPLLNMSLLFFFLFTFFPFPHLLSALSHPDPAPIQSFLPGPSPPSTVPAFPEAQSTLAACPLHFPHDLFPAVKSACGISPRHHQQLPPKTRCCPVLAAWVYAAYSATALGQAGAKVSPTISAAHTPSYDLPLLPDDSETCVDDLDMAFRSKGIELVRPNETCDMIYCYCGIRLHPLSCPEAFSVNQKGKLVGNKRIRKLERDCLSSSRNVNQFPGLGGCSKCLNTLNLLNNRKASNSSKAEDDRPTKMHNKDCQLMGLTWLLAKNTTAYIHTVSAVLRAMMMNVDGSNPRSCSIGSDGMPLAVDSSQISNNSVSMSHEAPVFISVVVICLLYILLSVPSSKH